MLSCFCFQASDVYIRLYPFSRLYTPRSVLLWDEHLFWSTFSEVENCMEHGRYRNCPEWWVQNKDLSAESAASEEFPGVPCLCADGTNSCCQEESSKSVPLRRNSQVQCKLPVKQGIATFFTFRHLPFSYLNSSLNSSNSSFRSHLIPETAVSPQQNNNLDQVLVRGFSRQIKACSIYHIIFYIIVCSKFAWYSLHVSSHQHNTRTRCKPVISACGSYNIMKIILLTWQKKIFKIICFDQSDTFCFHLFILKLELNK